MKGSLRVVVADDHPIVLEGLQSLLGRIEGVQLVGLASNGAEALELAGQTDPDVVILDLRMPVMDGVEALRRMQSAGLRTSVLVLTMYDNDEMLEEALRAGARGFLLKGAGQHDIERALESVASGEAVFGSGVADVVLARLSNKLVGRRAFPQLTAREHEVLELLAQGCGNQQLARKLFLSPKTVRNHVSNILAKIGAPDRAQAVVAAREAGYGKRGVLPV